MQTELIEAKDLATINRWCDGRNLPHMREDQRPRVGFWVPGIMAGFLLQTDSKRAYLDFFISNKESTVSERKAAIYNVTVAIFREANRLGYEEVMILTDNKTLAATLPDTGLTVRHDFACGSALLREVL